MARAGNSIAGQRHALTAKRWRAVLPRNPPVRHVYPGGCGIICAGLRSNNGPDKINLIIEKEKSL